MITYRNRFGIFSRLVLLLGFIFGFQTFYAQNSTSDQKFFAQCKLRPENAGSIDFTALTTHLGTSTELMTFRVDQHTSTLFLITNPKVQFSEQQFEALLPSTGFDYGCLVIGKWGVDLVPTNYNNDCDE